jgi:TetR/AcrR family transcriptional regulator, mexJK operon transcriptional repressor
MVIEMNKPRPRGRIPANELAGHEAELLDESFRLFRDHGFASVSVDMIARAARVSTKTIYARFGGKSGLFAAVIKRWVTDPLTTLDAMLNNDVDSTEIVLQRAARAFLDQILSPHHLDLHRMLIAEATRMPELSKLFYEQGPQKGLSVLASWLARQHARGTLTVPDPENAAEVFFALVEAGIIRRALLTGAVPSAHERKRLLKNAVNIFSRTYAPSKLLEADKATRSVERLVSPKL